MYLNLDFDWFVRFGRPSAQFLTTVVGRRVDDSTQQRSVNKSVALESTGTTTTPFIRAIRPSPVPQGADSEATTSMIAFVRAVVRHRPLPPLKEGRGFGVTLEITRSQFVICVTAQRA